MIERVIKRWTLVFGLPAAAAACLRIIVNWDSLLTITITAGTDL